MRRVVLSMAFCMMYLVSASAFAGTNYDYEEAKLLVDLGDNKAKEGKKYLAINFYKQAINVGAKKGYAGYAHLKIGKVYKKMKKFLKAGAHFKAALKIKEARPVTAKYAHKKKAQKELNSMKPKPMPKKPKLIPMNKCQEKINTAEDEMQDEMAKGLRKMNIEMRKLQIENAKLKKKISDIKALLK